MQLSASVSGTDLDDGSASVSCCIWWARKFPDRRAIGTPAGDLEGRRAGDQLSELSRACMVAISLACEVLIDWASALAGWFWPLASSVLAISIAP